MQRPRTYTNPDNFDISKRPSNGTLIFLLGFRLFLSALPGSVILPLIYDWLFPSSEDNFKLLLAFIGGVIGMAIYLPLNLRSGRRKRAEFVSAKGDPTGINDYMFGVMGGRKFEDGGWEWTPPEDSGDSI
jgi:hypothetical protein